MPKKVRRLALKTALSAKQADGKLIILDEAKTSEPKTKPIATALEKLGLTSALIVDSEELDGNLMLATRNIPRIELITADKINPLILIKHENVVIDAEALKKIESIYG